MKNFFTLLFFCCLFLNCSDDSNETTFTTPSTTALASRPEANPMFDNSYKGIYKGIVIGNVSGALYVDVLNDNKIWAKFKSDNEETYILENVPLSVDEGKDVLPIMKYRFANEKVSFEMKLDGNGNNITVSNFDFFSDNNSKVSLVKEKSTSLIKCYSGMFTGQEESGNVNFTSDGKLNVRGFSKKMNSTSITNVSGELSIVSPTDGISKTDNNNPVIQYQLRANLHVGQISGFLDGNKFDGNWIYEDDELGSWNATRIL